jgi:hypothetical protein
MKSEGGELSNEIWLDLPENGKSGIIAVMQVCFVTAATETRGASRYTGRLEPARERVLNYDEI